MDGTVILIGIAFIAVVVVLLHRATRLDTGILRYQFKQQSEHERSETLGRIAMYKPGDFDRALKVLEEIRKEETASSEQSVTSRSES